MFRFHDDENGVNDDSDTAESACAEPKDSCPNFAFVKTMQAEVSQQNAKCKRYPFVVFTCRGHADSFF